MEKIKKNKNKNEYLLNSGLWIRNFTKPNVPFIDINNLIPHSECGKMLDNEVSNFKSNYINISNEPVNNLKIIICSDGYDFSEKHKLLYELPKDVVIICVHGALKKWTLVGNNCPPEKKRAINYYVVNNPYSECLNYLPKNHRYYPKCIMSSRTNPEFAEAYLGDKYVYIPTPENYYSGPDFETQYKIDDYRSSICASIGISYKFGVSKLLLFCCDTSFKENRPGSIALEDGFYCYPQQNILHNLIDGNLYWLKQKNIKIGQHCSGVNFKNAEYINKVKLTEFFDG